MLFTVNRQMKTEHMKRNNCGEDYQTGKFFCLSKQGTGALSLHEVTHAKGKRESRREGVSTPEGFVRVQSFATEVGVVG